MLRGRAGNEIEQSLIPAVTVQHVRCLHFNLVNSCSTESNYIKHSLKVEERKLHNLRGKKNDKLSSFEEIGEEI